MTLWLCLSVVALTLVVVMLVAIILFLLLKKRPKSDGHENIRYNNK